MRLGLPMHLYAAAMIVCAFVSLLLGARAWFGTRKALARSYAFFQTSLFVWSVFRLVQWEIISPAGQLEALKLQYLGIVYVPASFYLMARALTKKPAGMIELSCILLSPVAFLLAVASDGACHYFWIGDALSSLPVNPKGAWGFWLFIAYAYSMAALSLMILSRTAKRSRGLFSRWVRLLAVLSSLPFATNAVFVSFFSARTGYDPTPIAFAIVGILVAISLRDFYILDTVPYAKNVLLESIDSPFIAIDPEGLVVGANEEARRISPSIDLLDGRSIGEIVPALAGALSEGDTREWSFEGVDYDISCHSVRRGRGRRDGKFFIFRDVSALAKARRVLEEARAKADAANAAKSSFVATVSHELRNPLNAIIGLADLDLLASPPAGLKDDLEVILSSGKIILGLVNDLLDLSKIEAGKMELERVDFDLHEKASSMLKSFRPVMEKKGIFLDISIEDGTPRLVKGDPLRYGQVLMNLVSNAIKFTERGAVAVSLSPLEPVAGDALVADPRSVRVLTSVRDTGIGIAPEQMPRLFHEFSQADPSVGRRFGGTGLGLSISKRIVGLFGGEIEVQSVEGRGSVFSFSARFEPGEESKIGAAPRTELAGSRARAMRVLVVDDDPVNGAVARRYLERAGHVAIAAARGTEALDMLAQQEFDLVLLDLGLPDMSGFEACRLIRSLTAGGPAGEPRVVAMTARLEPGIRSACASEGMADCLAKPLDPALLYRVLERVAESPRELGPRAAATVRASRPEAEERAPPPSAPGTPLIDEDALLARLDGDAAFMSELLGYFVEEAGGRAEALRKAAEARDFDALRRLGHALKGSSLSLCAGPIAVAAEALELACVKASRSGAAPEGEAASIAESAEGLVGLLSETVAAARSVLGREADDRSRAANRPP
jgi:signal transduction histidine kinase/DNA-binding NarL/FixJ family response regulator